MNQTRAGRPVLLAALLILLNTVAMSGQASWFYAHVTGHAGPADWVRAYAIAGVIEMIGVYLAGMAHAARMADQWAGGLQTGAYLIGTLAGVLNYDHLRGNPAAGVTFGVLSAISPWLWSVYSRHVNRERIKQLNRPPSRRFWHPIKTVRVISYAAWRGIPDIEESVMLWEIEQDAAGSTENCAPVSPGTGRTPADWVTEADRIRAEHPGISWEEIARRLGCTSRHLRNMRRLVEQGENSQ